MARLVIFTSGTLGDHLPYIALAQTLQGRGHDVLMVINQAMHSYAERAGVPAVALTDVARGPEEARQNAWAWDHLRNPAASLGSHPQAKAQAPEDFIRQIHELAGFTEGADLLLATAIRPHGLPAHLISGVPWATLSVNPSAFYQPPYAALREQQASHEQAYYNGIRPVLDRALREAGSDRRLPGWHDRCLWAPHVFLGSSRVFSEPDLEALQPFASAAQSGFWFWEDPTWAAWRPVPALQAFCDRRPLVLAFSSQPLEDPREILQKHVRAAALLEMPLLVQRGWAGFDEAGLPPESDPANVYFMEYAPHDWLFAHASATIQHGGIGSLARALRQFCPLVIEPFGNDQFYNAQRLAELGAGVALHPFNAGPERIAAAVGQALSKRSRLQARYLGRQLREEDGLSLAAEQIETLLDMHAETAAAIRRGPSREAAGARPLPLAESGTKIPRLIHQTWKDEAVPGQFRDWVESWRRFHPDWTFRLWTDADSRALIAEHYAWFLPTYDGYSAAIKRVDAARCFILHRYGGLYVDLDYEALRPLEPLLSGSTTLLLTEEPPSHLQRHFRRLQGERLISNALMASVPGHPFWEHLFALFLESKAREDPLQATGPFLLSRAYDSFQPRETITVMGYERLSPISASEMWSALTPALRAVIARDAYAVHHWYGSWRNDDVIAQKPALVDVINRGEKEAEALETTREALLAFSAEMEDRPLVSCLMVTRERPLLAQLAVHCFQKQSYGARELIIIDDGPDDTLEAWLAQNPDPLVRIFRLPDEGRPLGELRNAALEKARGALIAQWDDDDLSAPLRLELQVAALTKFESAGCLLVRELLWMPAARILAKSTVRLWEGSALLPRAAVDGYLPQRAGEETAVLEKALSTSKIVLLDMPELYTYTFHGRNTFDEAHWRAHFEQATVRYDGFRYEPALALLQEWLGVETARLGAYLAAGARQVEKRQAQVAEPAQTSPAPRQETAVQAGDLPAVLILTPVKDAERYLAGYAANVAALDYPAEKLSIAFLESDSQDNTAAVLAGMLPRLRRHFRRAELVRHDFGYHLEGPRWDSSVQRRRRSILAQSRNLLLQEALQDEAWVLWIDVDVYDWPADVLRRLLAVEKQIVTPNCLYATRDESFDLNSYKLAQGAEQLDWSPYLVDGLLQPPRGFGRLYLSDLREHELVELDGVGGTMLLVDADLHRDGMLFPETAYKGAIETEGLAVMAGEQGVHCWGMPNLIIRHR